MVTVKYKNQIIEIQEFDGKVIIHCGETHVAAANLEDALVKLGDRTPPTMAK